MSGQPPRPSSVVDSDQEALCIGLILHAVPRARILDVTYNRGRFWRGLPYSPHRMDIDPRYAVDTMGSFLDLPRLFPVASFDVIVFDPPHLPPRLDLRRESHALTNPLPNLPQGSDDRTRAA